MMIKNGISILHLNSPRLYLNCHRSISSYVVFGKIHLKHKEINVRRHVIGDSNRLNKQAIRSKLTNDGGVNNKSTSDKISPTKTNNSRQSEPKQTEPDKPAKQAPEQTKWLESQMIVPEPKTAEKTNSSKNIEEEEKPTESGASKPSVSNVKNQLDQDEPIEEIEDPDGINKDDFLTTIFENMEPYMDTYDVYTQLVKAGFKPDQADEIINLLIVQLNSKLSKLSTKYSQLYELENERYLFESAQQELRVDITRSRESHINELINLINILERDFNIISDELNNEFIQMKNDTQVAMNDQNSENTLHAKKIRLRIQETNHKITTELNSAMRSEIESLRWHISRWGLMAILVSVFSGCAVFYINKVKTMKRLQSTNEFVPLVIYEPSEYDEDDYHTDLDESLIS
mmetsp:Transcript_1219/g.1231  ORF Transcript_1219/g.1231 Transcript_1219/m.1231 type:complete len:402 (-) Transcript_1219:56-1261(-)